MKKSDSKGVATNQVQRKSTGTVFKVGACLISNKDNTVNATGKAWNNIRCNVFFSDTHQQIGGTFHSIKKAVQELTGRDSRSVARNVVDKFDKHGDRRTIIATRLENRKVYFISTK